MKLIKYVLFGVILNCAALSCVVAQSQTQPTIPYFSGVPLASNFLIIEDSILVFDKPQGQIAEVSMICDANCPEAEKINQYYDQALAGLGWAKLSAQSYRKDGQTIRYRYTRPAEDGQMRLLTFYSE